MNHKPTGYWPVRRAATAGRKRVRPAGRSPVAWAGMSAPVPILN